MKRMPLLSIVFCAFLIHPLPAQAQESKSVYLEDLTWQELDARMRLGVNTIIIPTGGTEQNGPHLALGKHNWIVDAAAGKIAQKLGNALVAPVIQYVPEGNITPPQGNMAWPGTISIREEVFYSLLADTASSFRQHGFTLICFLGDSGGNQNTQAFVARDLNNQWKNQGATVMSVNSYYNNNKAELWSRENELGGEEPQAHGGFMDTSELLAVNPRAVRSSMLKKPAAFFTPRAGVMGDPREAKAEYGKTLIEIRVNAAVDQIQRMQKVLSNRK